MALLAALVVVEAVADGRHLVTWTGRGWPGSAVGAVAVWRRLPFLVVVVVAAAVAALLRLLLSARPSCLAPGLL